MALKERNGVAHPLLCQSFEDHESQSVLGREPDEDRNKKLQMGFGKDIYFWPWSFQVVPTPGENPERS